MKKAIILLSFILISLFAKSQGKDTIPFYTITKFYKIAVFEDTTYHNSPVIVNGYIEVDSIGIDGVYLSRFDTSGNIEADTGTFNNIDVNSQTMDGTTVTGFTDSKTVMEGTEIESLSTSNDSLDISGKLISNYYIGQLYTDDGSVTVSTTPSDTYQTVTGLLTDINVNTTVNDSIITIAANGSGYYNIYGGFSYTHSANSTICHASLFINDVEYTVSEAQRKIGNGGDVGDAGRSAIVWLNGGDVVKFRIKADNTGTITIEHGNINVSRIN